MGIIEQIVTEAIRLGDNAGLNPLYLLALVFGAAVLLISLKALGGLEFPNKGPQMNVDEGGTVPDAPSSPPVSMEGRETDGMG